MSVTNQKEYIPDSPYPGIHPFSYAYRNLFFAREKETRDLVRLIVMYRGILLYSDSGTGKSSLINAGIIPLSMDEGFQPEIIRIQPKRNEEIIIERVPKEAEGKETFLPSIFASEKKPDMMQERVVLSIEDFLQILRKKAGNVYPLLIFDQFEEWITLFEEGSMKTTAEEAKTSQGIIQDAIVSIINDSELLVKVLIVLREDYLAKLAPFFKQCPRLDDQYLRLTHLESNQIFRVIRGPFEKYPKRYQPEVDSSLAEEIQTQLVERSKGTEIHLTEVQIVCSNLFEAGRYGYKLDQYFNNEGGVQGILERYLELALKSLEIDQREPAIALLSRMVTSAGTRNIISRDDLLSRVEVEDKIPKKLLNKALDNLEQNTKLVRRERRRDVYYYEISSEFLVGWIRRKAQERQRQAELRKLEEAQRVAEERRRQVEKQQMAEEKIRIARRMMRLSRVVIILFLVAVVIAVVAFFGWKKVGDTNKAFLSRELAASAIKIKNEYKDTDLSMLLALHAVSISRSARKTQVPEAEEALYRVVKQRPVELIGHTDVVYGVFFSPDGKRIATASEDETAKIWDAETGKELLSLSGHGDVLNDVAFSPDGKHIVTAGGDGTARVWDAETGKELIILSGHGDEVADAVFSPDGKHIATASWDETARVWDTETGKELHKLGGHGNVLNDIAFSPDGKRLATGSEDGMIKMWDTESGNLLFTIPVPPDEALIQVNDITFSADGKRLAVARGVGRSEVWDVASEKAPEKELFALLSSTGEIISINYSSDGERLVTVSEDGTVDMWAAEYGNPLFTIPNLILEPADQVSIQINDITFSSDGKCLAMLGSDWGSVILYTLNIEDLISIAITSVNRSLKLEECKKYLRTKRCPQTVISKVVSLLVEGKNLAVNGDTDGAAARFRKASKLRPMLDLDPDKAAKQFAALALVGEGWQAFNKGETKKAIDLLEKAVSYDPENGQAYYYLGNYFKEISEYNKAIDSLQKAIKIEQTPISYAVLADTYRLKKDYKQAIDSVNEALRMNPDFGYGYVVLGQIQIDIKRYEEASETLKKVKEDDPSYEFAAYLLAIIAEEKLQKW